MSAKKKEKRKGHGCNQIELCVGEGHAFVVKCSRNIRISLLVVAIAFGIGTGCASAPEKQVSTEVLEIGQINGVDLEHAFAEVSAVYGTPIPKIVFRLHGARNLPAGSLQKYGAFAAKQIIPTVFGDPWPSMNREIGSYRELVQWFAEYSRADDVRWEGDQCTFVYDRYMLSVTADMVVAARYPTLDGTIFTIPREQGVSDGKGPRFIQKSESFTVQDRRGLEQLAEKTGTDTKVWFGENPKSSAALRASSSEVDGRATP